MVGVKHSTVATLPDQVGKEVNKAEWNAEHTIDDASIAIVKLSDHTKANHDALGIDAATLESSTKAQVRDHVPNTHKASHLADASDGFAVTDLVLAKVNPDLNYTRAIGATNNRYYTGTTNATALTTVVATANDISAAPFIVSRRSTFDTIAINVTVLGLGLARIGVYNNSGCYPNALLVDSGALDISSTGAKTATINLTLDPGLYWLAFTNNVAVTLRGIPVGAAIPILGVSSSLETTPGLGYYKAFTYAALPDPFPASATIASNATMIAVFLRLSA